MHGGGRDDLGANLFSSMWYPANKAALPSQEEALFAKEVIDELELELKNTFELLEQMRSRISKLTTDLAERKAWIAPIRKIPVEILSEIFISASELQDLAPVTIMEVCRLWHTIVLSTPRAWSLIYPSQSRNASHLAPYVSTFLERSRPCLLHISVPFSVDGDEDSDESEAEASIHPFTLFMAHLSRIQCLSIPSSELAMLREANMPNLRRLRIVGLGEVIETFFMNRSQFPRLQSVHSTFASWAQALQFTSFPPLQYLAVHMDADFTWLDVGKNCANTLKSLKLVRYKPVRLAYTLTIVFPKLESLTIKDFSGDADNTPWMLQMLTPALASYQELSSREPARRSAHGDVKNVTTFRSDCIHDLSNYENLRVYQLVPPSASFSKVLANQLTEQLDQNTNKCPALQMVLFHVRDLSKGDSSEPMQNRIIEQIKNARPGVEVVITNQLYPMPGSMEESLVGIQFQFVVGELTRFQCTPDMPCREYR